MGNMLAFEHALSSSLLQYMKRMAAIPLKTFILKYFKTILFLLISV